MIFANFNMKQDGPNHSQARGFPRSPALTQPFTHSLFLEDGAVGECDLEGAVRVRDDEGDLPHAPE